MSRTDKDRPFWVRENDPTLGLVERHNHAHLGRTYTLYGGRRGERVLTPTGPATWVLRHTDGTPGMTVTEDAEANHGYPAWRFGAGRTGRLRWYFETPTTYTWPDARPRTRTVPDHCTLGEARTQAEQWALPCTYQMWVEHRAHRCNPTRTDRAEGYHRPARAYTRAVMADWVAQYNTFGEVDDDTWLPSNARRALFRGGYWD